MHTLTTTLPKGYFSELLNSKRNGCTFTYKKAELKDCDIRINEVEPITGELTGRHLEAKIIRSEVVQHGRTNYTYWLQLNIQLILF